MEFKPTIVAFVCNWCTYAGADLAGTSRFEYPANVRVVRMMCSCRFNPSYALSALLEGADGVLVSGCHPGECHYTSGNYMTRRRMVLLRRFLEHMGIHPDRFKFSWVSASEGAKWAEVVKDVTDGVIALGPNEIKREQVWTQQTA
ncbi:MAG: hydrogenase iron-sulfur subunit [Deltaproteobacteria bacterium]|nr:hydrogenase iron-sulfur subunit [Deltaproteobacteria bacterium]